MTYNCNIIFGTDANGSDLTLKSTNIKARQVPGTVKQIMGKRIIKRNVLARDIFDWDISIEGIYTGTTEEIETFKTNLFNLQGEKQFYNDGVSSHTGSYLIENNGIRIDETPDKYNNEHITYSLNLIEWNQEN